MRRARQERTVSRHLATGPTASLASGAITPARTSAGSRTLTAEAPAEDALHSSNDIHVNGDVAEPHILVERNRQLVIAIRKRIETRLPGRVRNLKVHVLGGAVLLEGQCATYYTKQLAQHAALGILDDERLENEIEVCLPR